MIQGYGSKSILAVTAICLAAICGRASADEKSHRAAAEDFLKAAEMDKSFDRMIDQSIDVQVKANPQLAKLKPVLKKFMGEHFNYALLKDDLIKLHMEQFTEEELKEIAAFYRTPTGKKTVEKMPTLFQKSAELGMKRVQDNLGELQRLVIEASKEKDSPEK